MAALPYIQLYPADYLADTIHLTLEEDGAYMRLIFNYWQTGLPLKDDDRRLSAICRIPLPVWLMLRPRIEEFFQVGNGLWVHNRIEMDLLQVAKQHNQRIAAGKASANARKRKENPTVVERALHSRSNGRSTNKDTDTDTDTDKPLKKGATLVEGLNTAAWEDFVKYRAENRIKKLQPSSVTKQQKWLVKQGNVVIQKRIVEQTIRQGWQGLQPLKGNSNGQQPIGSIRNDRIAEALADSGDPHPGHAGGNVPALDHSKKT